MSAPGRCAGCGETGPERAVAGHAVRCPEFAALHRLDPARALPPAAEHQRWLAEERPGQKAAQHDAKVADTESRRAQMAERFRTRDFLEDE
jgi:hypothetical protein